MGDIKLLKEMGERIFNQRKSLKMTQEELAEKLGVSTQMISNLENGKKAIRPENLVKLCEVLNISADYVLTGNHTAKAVNGISDKLLNLTDDELRLINNMLDYINSKK